MEEKFEHIYISFYTATVLHWQQLLKQDKYKEVIIKSLSFLVNQGRVKVYGFVLMPNHFHLLWKIMPSYTLSGVQRDFMKFTSQQIKI